MWINDAKVIYPFGFLLQRPCIIFHYSLSPQSVNARCDFTYSVLYFTAHAHYLKTATAVFILTWSLTPSSRRRRLGAAGSGRSTRQWTCWRGSMWRWRWSPPSSPNRCSRWRWPCWRSSRVSRNGFAGFGYIWGSGLCSLAWWPIDSSRMWMWQRKDIFCQ